MPVHSHAPTQSLPDQQSAQQSSPSGGQDLVCEAPEQAPVCEPEVPPREAFDTALLGGNLSGTLSSFDRLDPSERAEVQSDAGLQAQVPTLYDLLDSIVMLDAVWGDPGDTARVIFEYGPDLLLAGVDTCDPILDSLIRRLDDGLQRMAELIGDHETVAVFLEAYAEGVLEILDAVGLFGGVPDWHLFMHVITRFERADRQPALQEVRVQGLWGDFLASLGEEHVPMVQGWLAADEGDDTDQTLQERIDAAMNTARANTALGRVDALAPLDTDGRITGRLRELLALGVALPKVEGSDIATEGWLSTVQAERAARALIYMPTQEYLRLSMLLELTGDEARLRQSFAMLEAVAARADEFGLVQQAFDDSELAGLFGSGDLEDLEDFADETGGMDADTLARMCSVVQTQPGGQAGMIQKMSDSCGPTSAQVVRAEADPVEALRMNQTNQLGQDALDTDAAREQETALENNRGQTAVPRGRATVLGAVTTALPASDCTAAERLAITNYLNGVAFHQGNFDSGMPKLREEMGDAYPGDDALRQVRESASGTGAGAGLTPGELVNEANGTLDVDRVTGRPWQDLFDNTLWNLFTAAGRQVNNANMNAWANRVRALLNQAEPLLEQGNDVVFIVYWNNSGGHFMTFTNVRTQNGNREFLVHDPWTGNTQWVTEANIVAGNWPGGSGLICGLQG